MDGHRDVRLVGGPGDGGADILSAEPSGRLVAVQCKRQMAPVPVGVVRQLNGTLAHEHSGRAGLLVTTARLTRPAAALAASTGITVVDRDGLARWMGQARAAIDQEGARQSAGDVVADRLQHQPGSNWYWPDDYELRSELGDLAAYRRLSKGRLRMVLEAIEDYSRGWRGQATGLGGERVARNTFAIEHIMPQRWHAHWPLPGGQAAADRDALIDTIGNLTLLNGRLNSKVSNGPWSGPGGKRVGLEEHDVFMMNRQLLAGTEGGWDDEQIRDRTEHLIDVITKVWPAPEGHKSRMPPIERRPKRKVELADVVAAGLLEEGATLYARRGRHADVTATVLPDGRRTCRSRHSSGRHRWRLAHASSTV
jgi:hypothetical protein